MNYTMKLRMLLPKGDAFQNEENVA